MRRITVEASLPAFIFGMALFIFQLTGAAQSGPPDMRFGEIGPEAFTPTAYALDSSADAVYLFNAGIAFFAQARNGHGGFDIIVERHARIRLLHKNAFGLASMTLATSNMKNMRNPEIISFKGATFNIEDNRVQVSKLEKSAIFKEQSGDFSLEKIAFPNVREGSIIEYTYQTAFPGVGNLPSWVFQGDYPVLWSQYDVTIPGIYQYVVARQGYQALVVDTTVETFVNIGVTVPGAGLAPTYDATWHGEAVRRVFAMQDVPVLEKKEPFTTTLRNHISKVDFQLHSINSPSISKTYMSTWPELNDELMKNPFFGEALSDRNHWLDDMLRNVIQPGMSPMEKLRKGYAFVRDNFEGKEMNSLFMSQPLKKTWEEKKGNVADINMLLTAVCRHLGIEAAPAILSTRAHGLAIENYPLLKDYDYVICRAKAGGQEYLLDASRDYLGFGQLPEQCYNGAAHVIDDSQERIMLLADSQMEVSHTRVNLTNDDSADVSGTFSHTYGHFASMEFRNRMKHMKPDDFFESMRKTLSSYKTMTSEGLDSLDSPESPAGWHYSMKCHFTQQQVYFNPIMHERIVNPFSSAFRHYPVEMPYCRDSYYVLTMDIPKGYLLDEMPKSLKLSLSDSSCQFDYITARDGNSIQLSAHLVIRKANFSIDEYQSLREFYIRVAAKEKEQFVFKKMN